MVTRIWVLIPDGEYLVLVYYPAFFFMVREIYVNAGIRYPKTRAVIHSTGARYRSLFNFLSKGPQLPSLKP